MACSERVQIRDDEETLVLRLYAQTRPERACIVTEVETPRGPVSGKDAQHGETVNQGPSSIQECRRRNTCADRAALLYITGACPSQEEANTLP